MNGRDPRPVLEFLYTRLGLGELGARRIDLRRGQRAILDHDDIAALDRGAFGKRQRDDGFVGVGDQFDAVALQCARQLADVAARAAAQQECRAERGEPECRPHAANSKRMDKSTACTCLVMAPIEM